METTDIPLSYHINGQHKLTNGVHDHQNGGSTNINGPMDSNVEIQTLREQLEAINAEFLKANEERAKAAEYGLALLEEKQSLQYKNEELSILYDRTKQELDTTTMTLRQVQRDYEKRVKQVERQREDLIGEMDGRERELLSRVENLEEDKRGCERTIKKMSTQYDYISDNNRTLNMENDRLKQELADHKEDVRDLKRKDVDKETDLQKLRQELNDSRSQLDKLYRYEKAVEELNDHNQSLQSNVTFLQEQCDSIAEERDELEKQKRDIVLALNEEREVKSFLENKLREDMLRSPTRVSWLTESTTQLPTSDGSTSGHVPIPNNQVPVSVSAPTSPVLVSTTQTHSTPLLHNQVATPSSLFSEIQTSINEESEQDNKVLELNNKIEALEIENMRLGQEVKAMTAEAEGWKIRYGKMEKEKRTEIESLNDELFAKKEINSQLTSQLSVANKEKASFEIEIEGLREEMKRTKETTRMENEKIEKEFQVELGKCESLETKMAEMEDRLSHSLTNTEKLETILVNTMEEVVSMVTETTNIQRAVKTLQNSSESNGRGNGDEEEAPVNEMSNETYELSVYEGKRTLKVSISNQTLQEVARLKELLRRLKSPLEIFTRNMLQSSLELSSKLMSSGSAPSTGDTASAGTEENGVLRKNEDDMARRIIELESTLGKTRARLANRAEEVNQLRAIMKARQTTVDVTVSSLKSKLEGQKRAHEAELNQYKHKVKTLRKERDEQTSLGALTSRRCQEYLEEIGKVKRRADELRGEGDHLRSENKLLSVFLERAIKQKLLISQELEKYREEEERTRVIPLTLTSSRV